MMRTGLWMVLLLPLLALGGCGTDKTPPTTPPPAKTTANGPPEQAPPPVLTATPKDQGPPGVTLTSDELTEIRELPEPDRSAALAQKVCPVSGQHLGGMGKPVKVKAEGQEFFLCCDSCLDKVDANPRAVVAKLNKNKGK